MHHVLSMRLARDPGPRDEDVSRPRTDLVRRVVQATLVVYLSPVILTVLLIGGVAIAGARGFAAARQAACWLFGGKDEAGQPVAWRGGADRP